MVPIYEISEPIQIVEGSGFVSGRHSFRGTQAGDPEEKLKISHAEQEVDILLCMVESAGAFQTLFVAMWEEFTGPSQIGFEETLLEDIFAPGNLSDWNNDPREPSSEAADTTVESEMSNAPRYIIQGCLIKNR